MTQPRGLEVPKTLPKAKYIILGVVTTAVVLLDQWTKALVLDKFRLGESVSLLNGFFSLTYIQNPGAAFGLLAHASPGFRVPFFVVVPVGALAAIAYLFRKLPAGDIWLSTALSLVIGGAVGNLMDRLLLGFVVDFLDVHWKYQYHFPAFNVADSAICIGVGVLMLDLLLQDSKGSLQDKGSPANAPITR